MAIDLKTESDDATIGSSAVLFGADATNSASPSKYPIATVATQIIASGSILTSGGALGTPSGGTLTNCTGLPVSTGVAGLGTGVATAAGNAVDASGGLLTYASLVQTINAQTASYALVLGDAFKLVTMSVGSANNLTVPLNASVAFSVGTRIDLAQIGAGQTTVVATGGVTINATPGLKLRAQYSGASLVKTATDTWLLFGDLAA